MTGRVRVFLDVDGVISLPPADGWNADLEVEVPFVKTLPNGSVMRRTEDVRLSSVTLAFLQNLATRADIFWLTGWKDAAPNAFDRVIGMESKGWLDWVMKAEDFFETGKLRALTQFQAADPTPFVWVDDIATAGLTGEAIGFKDSLLIQTDEFKGLTLEHMEMIDHFVTKFE